MCRPPQIGPVAHDLKMKTSPMGGFTAPQSYFSGDKPYIVLI